MNKLGQIKQTLFTASDYADALAKLAAINANVTTYESYSVIDEFGIVFFATRKHKTLPMVITFDGVSPSVTIDEYYAVYAQQQPDLSKSVPAHDSLAVVEHLHPAPVWKNIIVQSFMSTRNELIKGATAEGESIPDFHVKSFMLGVSSMCGDGLINLARASHND